MTQAALHVVASYAVAVLLIGGYVLRLVRQNREILKMYNNHQVIK